MTSERAGRSPHAVMSWLHTRFVLVADYMCRAFFMHVPSHRFRRWVQRRMGVRIGNSSWLLLGVEIRNPQNVLIGDHSAINARVLLDGRGGLISIGDNVDIAQETHIWTLQHDPQSDAHGTLGADVIIEDYVWVAARATILPGVRIGRGAVVATGAVVTRDVATMVIVAGVPARPIGERRSALRYQLDYRPKLR
jgi:acetyltransferase-like isoleucine patch superfamily enzyme